MPVITSYSMQELRAIYPHSYELWTTTPGLSMEAALKRTRERPAACVICIKPLKASQPAYCSPACANEEWRREEAEKAAERARFYARREAEHAAAVAAKESKNHA